MTAPTAFAVDQNSTITPHVGFSADPVSGAPTIITVDNTGAQVLTPVGTGGGTPASTVSPKAAGAGATGTALPYARQDHAHPVNDGIDIGLINTTQKAQIVGGATTAILNAAKNALKDPAGGADIALGGGGGGTPSTTIPNPLGTAAIGTSTAFMRADAVIQLPTAAAINAFGLPLPWDPSTNTPTLASGVAPTTNNAFRATAGGTINLGNGITSQAIGDVFYFDGTLWQVVPASATIGIVTTAVLKGDNAGGVTAATRGVDFGAPIALSCGVPIILMPAGTVGSNGALTITGTAFSRTYSDGVWGYYPANAITGANAASFFWTVMSSTTAGAVYNTTYTPGSSYAIPGSPTAFSGTTGGAYTNAITTDIVLLQKDFGSNPMGANGIIRHDGVFISNTGSTAHNMRTKLNGSILGLLASASGSSVQFAFVQTVRNGGRTDRQICPNAQVGDIYAGSSGPPTRSSVDTSGSSNAWTVTGSLGATGDWTALESYGVVVSPAP